MVNNELHLQMNPTYKKLLKFSAVPGSIVIIWYAYIFLHTRAMFYLAPVGMGIEDQFVKYTSYLLPALVTTLILAVVFAPILIYLFEKRAIVVALIVTLPTSLYYLYIKAWPLEWFFFNIESFLLIIVFYLVIKLLFTYKKNQYHPSN